MTLKTWIFCIGLFIFLLILPLGMAAQKFDKGPVYKASQSSFSPHIMGMDEDHVYIADIFDRSQLVTKKVLLLESFDKETMERQYSKEVELKLFSDLRTLIELEKITFLDGYFVVIYSSKNTKHGVSHLYAQRIEGQTGEVFPFDTIFSTEFEDMPAIQSYQNYYARLGKYSITTSKNKKRLIVQYLTRNFDLDRYFEVIYVLNNKMEILKEKEIIKEQEGDLIPSGITIDDEGSIYYIEDGDLVLLDYFRDYEEWREPLPSDNFESNAHASRVSGQFNEAGDLIISAMYVTEDVEDTDENKEKSETKEGDTQLEGIISLKVNTLNKEIEHFELSRFDQGFIDEFLDESLLKKDYEAEVNDIFNNFRYRFTDSLSILVAEVLVNSKKGTDLLDLAVFAFTADGKLHWAHRIPRIQEANSNFKLQGSMLFMDDERFYVMFHDEQNNIENAVRNVMNLDALDHDYRAVPVIYGFNLADGAYDYTVHPDWNSGKYFKVNPYFGIEDGNRVFLFMQDRKNYQLTRISIGE